MPDRPECEIVYWAEEIGMAMAGGMDVVPLSSVEIKSWCEMMGQDLSPWEFRALRQMSRAYCSGLKSDTAPFEPLALKLGLASLGVMAS